MDPTDNLNEQQLDLHDDISDVSALIRSADRLLSFATLDIHETPAVRDASTHLNAALDHISEIFEELHAIDQAVEASTKTTLEVH